jgi:hypothetical protein
MERHGSRTIVVISTDANFAKQVYWLEIGRYKCKAIREIDGKRNRFNITH